MSYFSRIVLPSVGLPEKPSYTLNEVCKILQVSRRTVNYMLKDGRLPRPLSPSRGRGSPIERKRYYRRALEEFFSVYEE